VSETPVASQHLLLAFFTKVIKILTFLGVQEHKSADPHYALSQERAPSKNEISISFLFIAVMVVFIYTTF
jgi:hypothetical protein